MDTLTHIVAGAAVGELLLGKKVGKKAMLWGALAGNAPDVDAFMNFFVSDLDSLILHRGITHSVFVAAVVGPLLGWLLYNFYGRLHLFGWMMLFTINIWFHEFLDTCTMYGTALLLPFSDYRFAFNNIFVVDPLYTIPLLITVMALLILPKNATSRRKWNLAGIFISSIYMASTFFSQSLAKQSLQLSLQDKDDVNYETVVVPTLFNTLLWNVTAKTDTGFWTGYVSVFDTSEKANLYFIPKDPVLEASLSGSIAVQRLSRFSNGFFVIRQKGSDYYFHDLRFGQVSGWSDSNSHFGFSFNLSPKADNSMVVQQGRIEGLEPLVFKSMIFRAFGRSSVIDAEYSVHGKQHPK
ncbi:MAG: metal-dependent hydrolase [Bacteroidota bacterium]|jgi:inner membrane protein